VSGTAGSITVTISNTVGTFAAGQEVLLHQTQAASGPVGQYEFARVASVSGATLTLAAPLANTYVTDATRHAQIVLVPEYTTVTVPAGTTLTAPAWNGNTGGILVFDAVGSVSVAGSITMSDRGFRGRGHGCIYRCGRGFQGESQLGLGGATIAANGNGGGGGGAGQDDARGGGGGHGTAGAAGGNGGCGICAEACPIPGGAGGGAAGIANLSGTFLFGGAGGEGGADEDGGNPGRGGNGGGAIVIRAGSIDVTGTIVSNGEVGANGNQNACGGSGCGMGGGGGGAGGTIRLVVIGTAMLGTGRVQAVGGGGGASTCHGVSGSTGGVGRIGVRATAITGASNPAHDPN
jgi:hypothetical protein